MTLTEQPPTLSPSKIAELNAGLSQPRFVETGKPDFVKVPSLIEGFNSFPEYQTCMPAVVCDAIGELADEYDSVFSDHIMPGHVEEPEDYQYTRTQTNGRYSSLIYQVDMAGLPEDFLASAESGKIDKGTLKEVLRYRIFEFEDSAAMYNMMRGIHSVLDEEGVPVELSPFAFEFDRVIEDAVVRSGMPSFVIGAVTGEKYQALLATELGLQPGDPRSKDRGFVRAVTGFDGYVGPDEIEDFDSSLIYARTSAPASAQKNPELYDPTSIPALSDNFSRSMLRRMAMTLNIDNPYAGTNANDTKAAMPIFSPYSIAVDTENFAFLDPEEIADRFGITPTDQVRAKPLEAYGAYRQDARSIAGSLKPGSRLNNQVNRFGPYLLQPEIPGAQIETDEGAFGYIDRVFVAKDRNGRFRVIGGFRNLLPKNNDQAKKNTYHGNRGAIWAPIVPRNPRSSFLESNQ